MSFRPHLRLAAIAALSTIAFAAHAADVQVSCEKRSNRSKISIDGNNLASGSYRAVAKSGTRTATSDFATTVGDEVEFDFDSRAGDIAEGATAIGAQFHRRRPRQGLPGQRQRCPRDAGPHGGLPRPQLMSYGTSGIGSLTSGSKIDAIPLEMCN